VGGDTDRNLAHASLPLGGPSLHESRCCAIGKLEVAEPTAGEHRVRPFAGLRQGVAAAGRLAKGAHL